MATTKVNSEFIAVNAISGTIIADGAITSTHLAANCVDSSELVTGSIDTIHIAANQVTATKIVTNGVLTRHISDDQVTADKLANSINTDIATGPAALPKAGGTMTGNLTVNAIVDADNFKINNAQGTDGQVLTSTGSGVAWEDAAGTTINNNADNRIITGSGTANTLEGESSLTYDGLHLGMTSNHADHPSDANVLQLGGNAVIQGKTATGAGKSFRIMQNVYDDASAGLSYISTDEASHYTQVNGTHSFNVAASGSADAAISFTEAMKIDVAGNVGINETSPDFSGFGSNGGGLELDDVGANFTAIRLSHGGTGDFYMAANTGAAYLWGKANSPTVIGTNNTEAMRIDESQSIFINTTSGYGTPGYSNLWIAHSSGRQRGIAFKATSTSSTDTPCLFFNGGAGVAGQITYTYSATTYSTSSDYRLKENIVYDWDATTRLKQLKPCRFNWIADETNTAIDGFIAHEAAEVVPNSVVGEKDATKDAFLDDDGNEVAGSTIDAQTMDHAKLVPLLVKTIQELEARITTLEG